MHGTTLVIRFRNHLVAWFHRNLRVKHIAVNQVVTLSAQANHRAVVRTGLHCKAVQSAVVARNGQCLVKVQAVIIASHFASGALEVRRNFHIAINVFSRNFVRVVSNQEARHRHVNVLRRVVHQAILRIDIAVANGSRELESIGRLHRHGVRFARTE